MDRMEQLKAMLSLCLIFGVAFCLGSVVGHTVRVRDQAVMVHPAQKDWGLSFQEDNKPPVADESMEQLAQYDASCAGCFFYCRKLSGKKSRSGQTDAGGGTYHREPQLPSSGYEPDGKGRVSEGAGAAGRPVRADNRRKDVEVLPPAPG